MIILKGTTYSAQFESKLVLSHSGPTSLKPRG
jgi:hypothetical protein